MCGASKIVSATTVAQPGHVLLIGTVGVQHMPHVRVGAFHAPGKTPTSHVFCVGTDYVLTLDGISSALQTKYAIGARAVATFQESDIDGRDDVLDFGNGKRVHLREFADVGITVTVGAKRASERMLDVVLAEATRAARGHIPVTAAGIMLQALEEAQIALPSGSNFAGAMRNELESDPVG